MTPTRHIAISRGSALILTVVLTSLLAIVAVLFLMVVRIDRMGTTAVAANRELDFALDTVLALINEDLVADVPDADGTQEYYDYPDQRNAWLADLEPRRFPPDPNLLCWQQISNVGGVLAGSTRNVVIGLVGERDPVNLGTSGATADADGDGVGDARWFQVPNIMSASGRGQPVYAAVRIVDNGAMLNMNTGQKFDDTEPDESKIDGSRQLQVNLLTLAVEPANLPAKAVAARETDLLRARVVGSLPVGGIDPADYENEVTWKYLDLRGGFNPNRTYQYTPFDISDELELRYRYLLNHETVKTRIEGWGWLAPRNFTVRVPVDRPGELDAWFGRASADATGVFAGGLDPNYAYRHVATTYNMDRILTPRVLQIPDGRQLRKMINVNRLGEDIPLDIVRDIIADALREVYRGLDQNDIATQITANLKDYIDEDDEVTVLAGRQTSDWYGFERPCVYISEVACRVKRDANTGTEYKSYAIELHRPYFEDGDPQQGEWYLVVKSTRGKIEQGIAWSGTRRFHVLLNEDPGAPLKADYLRFSDLDPSDALTQFGYNPNTYPKREQLWAGLRFEGGDRISLVRKIPSRPDGLEVDSVWVPEGWIQEDDKARSIQRDVSPCRCFWRLWGSGSAVSLGNAANNYVSQTPPPVLQAHPANRPMRNIGELGMVFAQYGYSREDTSLTPSDLLVDLTKAVYSRLFNYLTVIDPVDHNHPPDETRVMGRININTAPWFVLAQLPWMKYPYGDNDPNCFDRARAITAYRNRSGRPFRSIGELMQITTRMVDPNAVEDYPVLGLPPDGQDNQHRTTTTARPGPDVTPDDARDDLEERDLIFTRISNLVTVRSDVFTAYILVRLGADGPQKRVIAILDRSRVNGPGDRVRVVAEHLVPDPR